MGEVRTGRLNDLRGIQQTKLPKVTRASVRLLGGVTAAAKRGGRGEKEREQEGEGEGEEERERERTEGHRE